mmetsp:Transcript_133409/g.333059  ORF Transcript_133409/g.333059 Transcript_133409/m.333059 type:complete len:186 (-) Transcript_133409:179-736(-)
MGQSVGMEQACEHVEETITHVVAEVNRGGIRLSDSDLVNHDLLQKARKGDAAGIGEALEQGAWTEFRRPYVNPKMSADARPRIEENGPTVGMTALMFSAQSGFSDCVVELLRGGARVNAVEEDGWSPLHFAAHGGHVEVCRSLMQAGANKCLRTLDGQTPLEVAQDAGHERFLGEFRSLLSVIKL